MSRSRGRLVAAGIVFTLALVTRIGAQNSQEHPGQYTQADIDAGSRLYAAQCVGCHGPNGDLVQGIDLRRGLFRRSTTDEDLVKVITGGIPGAGMPPFTLQAAEQTAILGFIRAGFDPAGTAVKVGNVARGKVVFDGKGNCLSCHRLNGRGPRVAPDLSDIGAARTPSALQRSILDPSSGMMPINRPVRIVMKNGQTLSGRRFNEDTFSVQIIDSSERLRSIDKGDITSLDVDTKSPMPSYATTLTADEQSDLIAYLLTLKG